MKGVLTDDEAKALVAVLTLAENHQMWRDPMIQSKLFKAFADEQYAAIQTVRAFLNANGVLTLSALAQMLAKDQDRATTD